jgi:hypothetical protein
MALQPVVGPWTLFQFLDLFTQLVRLLGRRISQSQGTHRTAQMQNKRTRTSMPQDGFEPTITMFEQAKTVHALDRAATVIGKINYISNKSGARHQCGVNTRERGGGGYRK